jgi:hypothetical protein
MGEATRVGAEFEEMIRPHLDYLYGLAVRLRGNRTTAEDLVQDASLKVFRAHPGLRNRERPRLWLTRILTTRSYGRFRAAPEADRIVSLDDEAHFDLFDKIVADTVQEAHWQVVGKATSVAQRLYDPEQLTRPPAGAVAQALGVGNPLRGAAACLTAAPAAALAVMRTPTAPLGTGGGVALAAHFLTEKIEGPRRNQRTERLLTGPLGDLADDYYLVCDVPIGRRRRVEHILVGPCGVPVVETRRVRGRIQCERGRWYVNGRRHRRFTRRVTAEAAIAKERRRALDTDPSAATVLRDVNSLIVFTEPGRRIQASRAGAIVTRASEFGEVIRGLENRQQMPAALVRRVTSTPATGPVPGGATERPLVPAPGG